MTPAEIQAAQDKLDAAAKLVQANTPKAQAAIEAADKAERELAELRAAIQTVIK
jgi:hypothetical protein